MILQRDLLHKEMKLFLSDNLKEKFKKQISEWIDNHKESFLDLDGDFRPDDEFKSDLADQFEKLW